jgi:hypothetical protein
MKRGGDSVKETALAPIRTIDQIRADVTVLKEHV